MTTTIEQLLIPYQAALTAIRDRAYGRVTLAEALILREAANVADVRNSMPEPKGGWRNALPLEHATSLGFMIRWKRTGAREDRAMLYEIMKRDDQDLKDTAETLANAENVFVDGKNWKIMTCDQLIEYARELLMYAE